MNNGRPPTAPKARAGLLTPPGIRRQARSNASRLRTRDAGIIFPYYLYLIWRDLQGVVLLSSPLGPYPHFDRRGPARPDRGAAHPLWEFALSSTARELFRYDDLLC